MAKCTLNAHIIPCEFPTQDLTSVRKIVKLKSELEMLIGKNRTMICYKKLIILSHVHIYEIIDMQNEQEVNQNIKMGMWILK